MTRKTRCSCTKSTRCDRHAALYVDAYLAAEDARPADVAAREDAATASAAAAFRAILDSRAPVVDAAIARTRAAARVSR